MTKLPDHLDEGIDFGGITVISRDKILHGGLEPRNQDLRVR